MEKKKPDIKKSILIILGILVLSLATIFGVYWFYRISLNPNPVTKDDFTKNSNINTLEEDEREYSLYIDNYDNNSSKVNIESVFDTDLKLQEALANSEKAIVFKGDLEFSKELQENYKTEILGALYLRNFKKACDYANEVIDNYDLNSDEFKSYEVFLYEVLELKDYELKSLEEKRIILEDIISPEIILFIFLSSDGMDQYNLLTYKDSDMVFGHAVGKANLIYEGNLTSNIYSEMRLNDVYFIVPDNIEGYKISFKLESVSYNLHYIRYKETNKLELVKVDNLSEEQPVSYKVYYSMY